MTGDTIRYPEVPVNGFLIETSVDTDTKELFISISYDIDRVTNWISRIARQIEIESSITNYPDYKLKFSFHDFGMTGVYEISISPTEKTIVLISRLLSGYRCHQESYEHQTDIHKIVSKFLNN